MSAVTLPVARPSRLKAFLARAFAKPAFVTGFAILVLSLALEVFAIAMPFFLQLVVDRVLVGRDRDLLTVLGVAFGALVVITVALGLWAGPVYDLVTRAATGVIDPAVYRAEVLGR